MRSHPGKAALAALALAEIGIVAGAVLASIFLATWLLLRHGIPASSLTALRATLPGLAVWGGLVGAPVGAVLLPLLGFTLLRRVPVGRAIGSTLGGALVGLIVAAVALPVGPMWPVPLLVPGLALTGVLIGAAVAWWANQAAETARRAARNMLTAA